MKFFTLIHICRNEQSMHNNSFVKSFEEQISLYLTCAKQLHRSLKPVGIELCVLTNDKKFLNSLNADAYPIEIIELKFISQFPSGLKFYSAHYKLEVFEYLASINETYIALVDSDMLCMNKIPAAFQQCIEQKIPLYYDITDQVMPAYGAEKVISDKERISGKKSNGLWAGGEFIAGPPTFFKQLSKEIDSIKANYFQQASSFHHQGDEVLTSVAIESLKTSGAVQMQDAGILDIVGRYWSYVPLHQQKSIDAHANLFLLHLPSDKKFIAKLQPGELAGASFFKKYKRHVTLSRALEKIFKKLKPYAKRITKRSAV